MAGKKKNISYYVQDRKSALLLTNDFSGTCYDYRFYRVYGVATAAGAEVKAEAPRSVITFDWSTVYGRFYEKIRG